MDRADQSVTRHAAASRAAYETLYAAFAAQPGGIKDTHRGVLRSLRGELRLDQSFADGVTARHDSKRQRSLRGSSSAGGHSGEEKSAGGGSGGGGLGDGGLEVPGIQIKWKEARRTGLWGTEIFGDRDYGGCCCCCLVAWLLGCFTLGERAMIVGRVWLARAVGRKGMVCLVVVCLDAKWHTQQARLLWLYFVLFWRVFGRVCLYFFLVVEYDKYCWVRPPVLVAGW